MIAQELITCRSNKILIYSNDEDVIEHFQNPNNFVDVIIAQINEEHLYDFMLKDKKDLVILDIGANIGIFALHVADIAKDVYCVEPTPSHFNLLTKITESHKNIHRLQAALHNEYSAVDFYLYDENSTMNSTVNQYGNKIPVQGYTLENLLNFYNLNHVDFIKCDIEGSEMAAITYDTVKAVADKVDNWFLEIHATQHGDVCSNRDHIKNIFQAHSYQTLDVKHDGIFVYR